MKCWLRTKQPPWWDVSGTSDNQVSAWNNFQWEWRIYEIWSVNKYIGSRDYSKVTSNLLQGANCFQCERSLLTTNGNELYAWLTHDRAEDLLEGYLHSEIDRPVATNTNSSHMQSSHFICSSAQRLTALNCEISLKLQRTQTEQTCWTAEAEIWDGISEWLQRKWRAERKQGGKQRTERREGWTAEAYQ